MMLGYCNPSTGKTETGGFWRILLGQASLISELLASKRPCFKRIQRPDDDIKVILWAPHAHNMHLSIFTRSHT